MFVEQQALRFGWKRVVYFCESIPLFASDNHRYRFVNYRAYWLLVFEFLDGILVQFLMACHGGETSRDVTATD